MKKATIIFILGLPFLPFKSHSQAVDSTWKKVPINEFYTRYSPTDFLRVLEEDFKDRKGASVFILATAPDNWIKEEHIEWLMNFIYRTDSTKSIMNAYSSYMPTDKYSSIGREAQNLVNCFRNKKNYPDFLNSFGLPDRAKAKELASWWSNYKLRKQ
jgi:hypothetical protein